VDLSYLRFDHDASVAVLPPDLAVLMVGISARQAASPTALTQTRLFPRVVESSVFFPLSGAFDADVAARIVDWGQP
jgi:hypothetical protein